MYSRQSYEGQLEAVHQQHSLLNAINKRALDARDMTTYGAMDKIQAHDEDTVGSGSGSGISDFSALENETDEFGRMLLQHQRDVRRLNNAVHGGNQAFRKARPNPRIVERLAREEQERDRVVREERERASSGGSNDSEPPVTVPREWGRRARKQTDWLRKITAPSDSGDVLAEDIFHTSVDNTRQNGESRSVYHVNDALQDTPPSMRRSRYAVTPSSLRHMNTTLGPLTNSEDHDQDFTSDSLIASTPAPTKYHRKIDYLAQREIEELENSAVTTRALDQMDQQSPNATRRKTSSTRLRERAIADGVRSPVMRPNTPSVESESPSRIPVRRTNGVNNKENAPFRPDANEDRRANGATSPGMSDAQSAATKRLPRPVHQRNDSMSLLKRLARVSSKSPSPGQDQEDWEEVEEREISRAGYRKGDDAGSRIPNSTHGCDSKSAKERQSLDGERKTQITNDEPANPQTPVVTGAWVDTTLNAGAQPAPTNVDSIHKHGIEAVESNQRTVKNEPPKPKSALEDIMLKTKRQEDSQQYGESTLQSLENVAHPNLEATDASIMSDLQAVLDQKHEGDVDSGQALTQTEKDRRQEDLAVEAMHEHLRRAQTSIKDADRGLQRVENKVDATAAIPAAQPDRNPTTAKKHTTSHTGHTHCQVCGAGYQSVWRALYIEFRSCFFTYDPSSKYRIRFTWLGLTCLLWWTWFLSESTLCEIYCKPEYHPGPWTPDPKGNPVFPFVIPTLLFRPVEWLWRPVCEAVGEALMVGFHAVFGDILAEEVEVPSVLMPPLRERGTLRRVLTSTLKPGGEWVATATTTAARVVHSVFDAVDEVGSIWDDYEIFQ